MVLSSEDDFGDTLKAFVHMGLDKSWVFGLSQNLKEIFIGEEEESGKNESLLLKVVVQFLLNCIKPPVCLFEVLSDTFFIS